MYFYEEIAGLFLVNKFTSSCVGADWFINVTYKEQGTN